MEVIVLIFFSIICPFLGLFIAGLIEGCIDCADSFKEIFHYIFGYVFGGIYFFTLMFIIAKFGVLMK